jgi:very-short-patch-repair endonuclease
VPPPARHKGLGRKYVAVVGINRYGAWPALGNAVQDARGTLEAFVQLGFTQARGPLIDEAATGSALHRLVTDDLATLGTEDSLVLFFAGHGHNVVTTFDDGTLTKNGYLIPADAGAAPGQVATWVGLDSWLGHVSKLPPRHILVILDACHSGVALDPVIRWRGEDVRLAEPIETLRGRRSRRIITSALDDQLAMDCGPIPGHSLFTGCLIEALTGGLVAKTGAALTTGSALGMHVQHRVTTYPSSKQTPDFGALHLDNRGELIFELPAARGSKPVIGVESLRPINRHPVGERQGTPRPSSDGRAPRVVGVAGIRSLTARVTQPTPPVATPVVPQGSQVADPVGTSAPASGAGAIGPSTPPIGPPIAMPPAPIAVAPAPRRGPALDAAFVAALERHQAVRAGGGNVLSVVTADPMTAVTGWATWAASHGQLTLISETTGLDATVDALLAQMPWLRMLPAARAKLAAVARCDVTAVDGELDRRTATERASWIDDVSRHDLQARVSGWLLCALREPWAQVPDLETAPVQGIDLLAILCELTAPVTVLLHHADPAATWLAQAIQTAFELVRFLPRRAIAIGAPGELLHRVVRAHPDSAALSLARQGMVPLAARPARPQDPQRGRTEQRLHAALANDPRTAGVFEPNVQVPIHDRERAIEVDLVARDALLAIEIDDWYGFRDPQAYHRDRIKDVWLQRAGFFVMRFLVEDVEERLEQTVNEVALGLAGRRAAGPTVEKAQ